MLVAEALCDCELARLEVGEFHSKLKAGEDLSEVGETPHHRCEVRNASGLRTRGQSKASVLGVEGHLLQQLTRRPGSMPKDTSEAPLHRLLERSEMRRIGNKCVRRSGSSW